MGNLKRFVGEYAYNIIQNMAFDEGKIRKALVTPRNARNVFSKLSEYDVKSLCSDISCSENIGTIRETTQDEIIKAFENAGYDTVIFDDFDKINECKKYYAENELICTYRNLKGLMNEYHMIVALKKNIDDIKRSKIPNRDDEYGTSILNIQIAKNGSHMSIKNRYNHTVSEPDRTLNNNLNKLHKGLQSMVLGYYKFACLSREQSHYKNIVNINNIYLKYSNEAENIYYGEFVLDGKNGARYTDNSRYYVFCGKEYNEPPFILDFKEKKVISLMRYGNDSNTKCSMLTRAMQDGVLTSENKAECNNIQYVIENAKKELLKCRNGALKFIHQEYGYDFTKPYKVTGILGSFTANSIFKITKSSTGVLLVCYNDNVRLMDLKRGVFSLSKCRHTSFDICEFYAKRDFEDLRKSKSIAVYVIQQDKEYIQQKSTTSHNYSRDSYNDIFDKCGNNLTEIHKALEWRLKEYKDEKKRKEVAEIDYTQEVMYFENSFADIKKAIVNKLVSSETYEDYYNVSDVLNYRLMWLIKDIENFKKRVEYKKLSSKESAENMIKSITETLTAIKSKI